MKAIALALGVSLMAGSALAAPLQWVSAPVFVGQTMGKNGPALTYYPSIVAITPDGNGLYEVWTQVQFYSQESFADHQAIQMRAACNKTGDNSCVAGMPGWVETFETSPVYPQ